MKKIKIKIVYAIEYFERELFLLEISGKFLMVYKGSGLNNPLRTGDILPFMFLNDRKKLTLSDIRSGIVPGYIYKEMLYNKKYINHKKNLFSFNDPTLNELFQFLKDELSLITLPKTNFSIEEVNNVAKSINEDIRKIINNNLFFDYKLDLLDRKYIIQNELKYIK